MNPTILEFAKMIDHSILHPTFTDEDLERECVVARDYNVASVCVKPYAVKQAVEHLRDSDVAVGAVIGFPAGNSSIKVKVFETEEAIINGAAEIDMVINIGKTLQGDWTYVENEITAVTEACHAHGAIVKVIFENDFILLDDDKIKLCRICTDAKADFVKTSTGYGFVKQPDGNYNYRGATITDVKLMRQYSGESVKIKAAGGIRTLDDLIAIRQAGAERVGATATKVMLDEAALRFGSR